VKKHYYKHGLPFSETLALNMDRLIERVMINNKAGMIIIDGGVGEGKTTLAVQLGDYASGAYQKIGEKYQVNPKKFIEFENQLGMGGEQFVEKVRLCYENNLHVVVYDEGGDFNKRGSLTSFNGMLNRTFETYRAFKVLVIICLPSFHVLDNDLLLKKIPRLLLHLYKRTNHSGNFKGYSLKKIFYIADRMKHTVVKDFAYQAEECNFHGHFLDLEPNRMKKLSDYSIKGKLEILQKAETKFQKLMTIKEIADSLNVKPSHVSNVMSRYKQKPVKYIKHRAFYSNSVLEYFNK
jgi:hypothetical protein